MSIFERFQKKEAPVDEPKGGGATLPNAEIMGVAEEIPDKDYSVDASGVLLNKEEAAQKRAETANREQL